MTTRWCLTSLRDRNTHLEGPFNTYAEANQRAVKRLSEEAKWEAAYNRRHPVLLIAVPCTQEHRDVRLAPVIRPDSPPTRVSAKSSAPAKLAARVPLPATIYKLPDAKLRYFCQSMNIAINPTDSRAEIIAKVERDLCK